MICSSVPSSPPTCVKKNCSASATSEEDFVTSMGVVCTSSRILTWIFYLTLSSNLVKKSAVVLTEPAICAILKMNCSTKSHAFHHGGIALAWRIRLADLLSVKTIVGFGASHRMFTNSGNAM